MSQLTQEYFKTGGIALILLFQSCAEELSSGPICTQALSGDSWVPNVSNASISNHDSDVTVSTSTLTGSGPLMGLAQGLTPTQEVSVNFSIDSSLGRNGSFSLTAQVSGINAQLQTDGYPFLVELVDPNGKDWVNLKKGSGEACRTEGFFSCPSFYCTINDNCTVNYDGSTIWSAFTSRRHWEQFQRPAAGVISNNTFPTCNWSSGSPACAFNQSYFEDINTDTVFDELPVGSYTAKYALVASSYKVVNGYTANLTVTLTKREDNTVWNSVANGAVDLNVIIVGTDNVQASRTPAGQRNLNALVTRVGDVLENSGAGIKLGEVSSVEWRCEDWGDAYADFNTADMGTVLSIASNLISDPSSNRGVNLLIVDGISDDSLAQNQVILGLASTFGGPGISPTSSSGVAVATFGQLDAFNSSCGSSDVSCAINTQDTDFFRLTNTVTHEVGHYLGLNHPSEQTGSVHDPVPDTPECAYDASKGYVSHDSCLDSAPSNCSTSCTGYSPGSSSFCSADATCQFNHVMWWTTKNFNASTQLGDGNLFSTQSSAILNYSPLVY